MAAHQVMIFNVYGDDEALLTVRLHRGSSDEGITSGYSVRKNVVTIATIATPESANDQPSRPARLPPAAAISAEMVTAAAIRLFRLPLSTWVQARNPKRSTAV